MRRALELARDAAEIGEVPIGAVLVDDATGEVIASQHNCVETTKDATAHAEMLCIREASRERGNWRLGSTTLYCTLEPCPMCISALALARVDRVVYGETNDRLGACGTWMDLPSTCHPFHTFSRVDGGVLREESAKLLISFFRSRRQAAEAKRSSKHVTDIDAGHQYGNEIAVSAASPPPPPLSKREIRRITEATANAELRRHQPHSENNALAQRIHISLYRLRGALRRGVPRGRR
uniref:tRNA(adenine(34)) deaminase n=2 Tax=Lotharella oceanica TaxID=641309 RepID=A0A7S2TP07_9EUKA|mmetsp:Transcript_21366/g.40042  ORF Transcript_21366/g.40042 Transcript_21366/m.40042 type:complete len:236 (+) Transcript_21366:110-817(+)